MKKNLAFFGAFNPPTLAHLDLAKFALDETGGEMAIFVPSKEAYIPWRRKSPTPWPCSTWTKTGRSGASPSWI